MEPEPLIARVQELTGRLEDLDHPICRDLAEELTSAYAAAPVCTPSWERVAVS